MDSELIEKARLAFVEAWEARSAEDGPREPGDRSRAGIRAALAVFEEAWSHEHTVNVSRADWERLKRLEAAQKPSDDEREALARALNRDARRIRESRDRAGIEFGSMTVPIDVMLKLTESAPSLEPQTEPTDAQAVAVNDTNNEIRIRDRVYCLGVGDVQRLREFFRSGPQTEPTEPWMCATCGGTTHEHSLTTSTCVWTPVPTECWTKHGCDGTACDLMHRESQTEPTGAQVRAAWDSLGPSVTIHLEYEQLIAALRAAAETINENGSVGR